MSQTPLLFPPSLQQIELIALQRFTIGESRHRLLREETDLRSLHLIIDHELNILNMLKELNRYDRYL